MADRPYSHITTPFNAVKRFAAVIVAIAFTVASTLAQDSTIEPAHHLALIETTTLTAAGEAVRVYTTLIDINTGLSITEPVWLPGVEPEGRIALDDDGRQVAFITRTAAHFGPAVDETYVSAIDGASNRLASDGWLISEPGWRHVATCMERNTDGNASLLVTLLQPLHAGMVGQGRIEARALSPDLPASLDAKSASWLLPGPPVAAVPLPNSSRVAVLCTDTQHGPVLHVRDVDRGEVVVERAVLFEGARGLRPAALERSGPYLLALATGPGSGPDPAQDASWLRAIAIDTLERSGAPMELSGVSLDDAPSIHPASDGSCWAATREPKRGFAYLAHVQANGDTGPAKLAEYSFSGITRALCVAPAATGPGVALAIGERVEVWQEGKPGGNAFIFDAPVNALVWTQHWILVGEGNRIHRIRAAADLESEGLTEFQTGVVSRIVPVSGPHDIVRPESEYVGSPRFTPPRIVHFRGESAGRELHAVEIDAPHAGSGTWRLEWDRHRMPWLNAYPTSGTVPGWFFMGVDDRQYTRGTTNTGWLNLYTDFAAGQAPGGSGPYRIVTRVAPGRPSVRRVLWALSDARQTAELRGSDDAYGLRVLADLLASPPLHFSHHLAVDPVVESLENFSVVVLESNAILSGIVTRQAILDYVSGGGALLYVLQPLGERDPAMIARWLSPAGLIVDPTSYAPGRFEPVVDAPLTRQCAAWTLQTAVSISVDAMWQVLVAGDSGNATGLAVREYSAGRIAVLAARAPLESGELTGVRGRRFATDLFQWLGDAGQNVADLDADELPDAIEDANGDGAINPGETDRMNPDTDGDGVPDGAEDRNRNGLVDDGETSPLNPDTDGDGIYDGADLSPVASPDAPRATGP